mmetsp:Transcript_39938/g.107104  ORF Transcript_39938/g.107104 Transcript_39938/m.107104 type:complete len:398 (-) Transcript_39938:467-1660(-)
MCSEALPEPLRALARVSPDALAEHVRGVLRLVVHGARPRPARLVHELVAVVVEVALAGELRAPRVEVVHHADLHARLAVVVLGALREARIRLRQRLPALVRRRLCREHGLPHVARALPRLAGGVRGVHVHHSRRGRDRACQPAVRDPARRAELQGTQRLGLEGGAGAELGPLFSELVARAGGDLGALAQVPGRQGREVGGGPEVDGPQLGPVRRRHQARGGAQRQAVGHLPAGGEVREAGDVALPILEPHGKPGREPLRTLQPHAALVRDAVPHRARGDQGVRRGAWGPREVPAVDGLELQAVVRAVRAGLVHVRLELPELRSVPQAHTVADPVRPAPWQLRSRSPLHIHRVQCAQALGEGFLVGVGPLVDQLAVVCGRGEVVAVLSAHPQRPVGAL